MVAKGGFYRQKKGKVFLQGCHFLGKKSVLVRINKEKGVFL
jgi:hypothetical protein